MGGVGAGEVLVMAEDEVIPYAAGARSPGISRPMTILVLVLTILLPASFGAFVPLRAHQLSLPDPYNNPYTDWSTACLLTFFATLLVEPVVLVRVGRRIPVRLRWAATVVVVLACLPAVRFVYGCVRFMLP